MTARIFAYIAHKGGVADDSAAELFAAAKKIDPAASPTAVVTGTGAELDAVCESLRASYGEVWKIAGESLAYPNAELVRKALVKVIPTGSVVLVAHNHFGIDLAPGSLHQAERCIRFRRDGHRWRRGIFAQSLFARNSADR